MVSAVEAFKAWDSLDASAGADPGLLIGVQQLLVTKVKVLEYKYNLDGLVEELQSEVKDVRDIGLAVAWEMGTKWKEMFDITCLLDDDTAHHRQVHERRIRLFTPCLGCMRSRRSFYPTWCDVFPTQNCKLPVSVNFWRYSRQFEPVKCGPCHDCEER